MIMTHPIAFLHLLIAAARARPSLRRDFPFVSGLFPLFSPSQPGLSRIIKNFGSDFGSDNFFSKISDRITDRIIENIRIRISDHPKISGFGSDHQKSRITINRIIKKFFLIFLNSKCVCNHTVIIIFLPF